MQKRRAFLMIELFLVIGVVIGFLGFFYTNIYAPQQKALLSKEDIKNQIVIKRVLNQYIMLTASFNRELYKNDGVIDSLSFIKLEPLSGIPENGISFQMHKNIVENNVFLKRDLLEAKCLYIKDSVGVADDYYGFRCLGVGSEINLLTVRNEGLNFNDIYSNKLPSFILNKYLNGKETGKSEFAFIDTYLGFREKSLEKINVLKKRITTFNKTVYINEIGNPCTVDGGLDSWDDFNIPWIWKIHSKEDPNATSCAVDPTLPQPALPSITCDCSNLVNNTDLWTDRGELIQISGNGVVGGSTVEDYLRVLRNLSLPKTYRYDEVGNPINLFLFTTIDTDTPTVLTDVAPNPPTEHYKVSDDNMTINQYRQGEIFASPAFIDPINGMDSFFHNSRIVFFYD